ncbi:MAG: hypothetical protein WC506_05695 [Candidatus Micrarchaeia archaeon]
MDLSECFSPRPISKVILALALFVLFVPFIQFDTGIQCMAMVCKSGGPCPVIHCDSTMSSSIALYLYSAHFTYPNTMIQGLDYFAAAAGLVLSYLVSCIGFLAYGKIKPSK